MYVTKDRFMFKVDECDKQDEKIIFPIRFIRRSNKIAHIYAHTHKKTVISER